LDDELLYVARSRTAPRRYAVAIRGTNPGSAFDWVFGDLWAGRQTAWPYGDGSARISLSTALGLATLRRLRSDGPRGDGRDPLWQVVDARTAALPGLARSLMGSLAELAQPAIEPLRHVLAKLVEAMARHRAVQQADGDDDARIRTFAALWNSNIRALLMEL